MNIDFIRDHIMYVAIFGTFATVWFGWAQENPPKKMRGWLIAGSVLSFLTAFIGIYLAATHWHDATALSSRDAYIQLGVVVAAELALGGIGAFVLAKRFKQFIASWIAFVVGLHFIPLSWIFFDIYLSVLGAMVMTIAGFSVFFYKKTKLSASFLTGSLTGIALLTFALLQLLFIW
ncbi:MAG: hypothetical protein PVI21_02110 [Candidatus Woesebacteria bacterium]